MPHPLVVIKHIPYWQSKTNQLLQQQEYQLPVTVQSQVNQFDHCFHSSLRKIYRIEEINSISCLENPNHLATST